VARGVELALGRWTLLERECCGGEAGRRTACDDALEAHVEGGVGVRREGVSVLAVDIFGLVVVVAHRIADLAPSVSMLPHPHPSIPPLRWHSAMAGPARRTCMFTV
jgi:hypothetical protein